MRYLFAFSMVASLALAACSGGSSTAPLAGSQGAQSGAAGTSARGARPNVAQCAPSNPTPSPVPTGAAPFAPVGISVPSGFHISVIANVSGARELAFSPNGDLFVGTTGSTVYLIQDAEATPAGTPHVFTDTGDSPAAGVAVSLYGCALYVGSQFAVWRIPYTIGDQTAQSSPQKIASLRPAGSSDHSTTSVAVVGSGLYASIGSSSDANWPEIDSTRATIQQMGLHGENIHAKAVQIRNAIALAVNPATNTLWAGGAGQDSLPAGHPFEYFDGVSLHPGSSNYGWPQCEENHRAYTQGANCSNQVVPLVENQAYQTIIGATFYPPRQRGAYTFAAQYLGGAFLAMHGSWHRLPAPKDGIPYSPPRVRFVPMTGDTPKTPVNWSNPMVQSSDFVWGFQRFDGSRLGLPTGIAVGPQGDLFVADDQTGYIYRVRP